MIATDFDPLFWRSIVIAAIIVVFVVGALVVRAMLAAGHYLRRSARLPAETTSGRRENLGSSATHAHVVRDATRQAAGNDPARPDRFHKEAA
jgi:hypothetical protein